MIIRREAIQAALAATTADNTRCYLHAIQAEPTANRIVATNGHILLIATDRNPMADVDFPVIAGAEFHGQPEGSILIDAEVCKSMLATMPKKTTLSILATAQLSANGTPTTATIAATDLSAPRIAIIKREDAGMFPAYDRVLPKADREGVRVCLAVDVLEQLIKAAKAVKTIGNDRHKAAATITFDVPTGKADLRDGAVISALGVTMIGPDVTVTGAAMPCRM